MASSHKCVRQCFEEITGLHKASWDKARWAFRQSQLGSAIFCSRIKAPEGFVHVSYGWGCDVFSWVCLKGYPVHPRCDLLGSFWISYRVKKTEVDIEARGLVKGVNAFECASYPCIIFVSFFTKKCRLIESWVACTRKQKSLNIMKNLSK